MNKTFLISLFAGAGLLSLTAAVVPVSNVRLSQPMQIVVPAMSGDSTDNNGAKYSDEKMLDTRVNSQFKNITGKLAAIDSSRVALDDTQGKLTMQLLATRLRSDRFAKGKLKVNSPERFVVLVDNEEKGRKVTLEDTLTASAGQEIQLDLQPYHDYDIVIKALGSSSAPFVEIGYEPEEKFADAQIRLDSEMKRRMRVDNVLEGKRVSATRLSPDGKYTLVSYATALSSTNTQFSAAVYETATGNVIVADVNTHASWMPKGNVLYYPKASANGWDILTLDIPTMKTNVLVRDVEDYSLTFAPDASWLIYYKEAKGPEDEGPLKRQRTPDDRIPGDRDRQNMVLQYVASGLTRQLTYGNLQTSLLDIAPDSKHILYMSTRQDCTEWPFYYNSIISMDVNTLATDTLINNDGAVRSAIWNPDCTKLFVVGGPNMLGGVGLNMGDHPIPNDFDSQGIIYDIRSKKAEPITLNFDPSIDGEPVWNKKDGKIYFLGVEGFYQNIYSYDPKTAKFTKIPAEMDVVYSFSMGDDEATWLTYTGSTLRTSGAAYAANLKTGKTVTLDTPRAEVFDGVEFGTNSKWTFKASDGTVIDGEMTLPPDFDPSKKYPMIVYYYGGTTPSNHRIDHAYTPNLLASRGYVVYVINPSGTIGYGQEFSARHVNAWGRRTADDIIEGVKEFCKEHPFVNDKKIGCMGASYGGFMTQYLQTRTDIFAAAVSHAGISNVTSYWGEGYWGYSYNAVAAAKSYPWTDPQLFTEQGSLFNADKIHTPLLLLHGTEDTNVPIGESIQLFNALKILGRDVEFITVDAQNHVITDVDKKRLWQNTIMAWFEKYLKDDPSWWNSLYGK